MSASEIESVEAPEELPLSDAELADIAAEDERIRVARLSANVGPTRPADGLEARVERLEQVVRTSLGAAVLRPEEAVAAAEVQDEVAAEAEQAHADAEAAAADVEPEPGPDKTAGKKPSK